MALTGVVAVYHRANIGKLYRVPPAAGMSLILDERRPPLEDDQVRYYGQYVAAVVANTMEQARAAAEAVKVKYNREKPDAHSRMLGSALTTEKPEEKSKRGDTAAALASTKTKVDAVYTIPVETHNPIELHASVAVYDGERFTLYETSQAVVNHRDVLAQMLGVPPEQVQVITRFLGSGFGGILLTGTQHNDAFRMKGGKVRTLTNRSGGIQGGISNGETIYFRVAFKPVATVNGKRIFSNDLDREADRLKRLSLRGELIVQSAGGVTHVSWKYKTMKELADGVAQG